MATRLVALIGLGFGDCGKGLFTDFLTRHWNAHTVVRFNGGAQAGHNVVLPDRRHHTFSQFSAGTLVPGVCTVLAYPVVVHPGALLIEHAALQRLGVHDAWGRLLIDARCRINTPFHQAGGRLREWARGSHAHGSCGVGVGETVRHGLQHPDQILRYGDLANPARALALVGHIRHTLQAEFEDLAPQLPAALQAEWALLAHADVEQRWLAQCQALIAACPPAAPHAIAQRLHRPGTVLLEGAQGVLLDEWRGFHPHTTWSSITTAAAQAVAADAGCTGPMTHLGIVRSYLTRHGAGPLPTHDPALDALPEPHNAGDGWQGAFRRAHPDGVLLRYALAQAGPLDGLLVSHLDVLDHTPALRWCQAYTLAQPPGAGPAELTTLPIGARRDLQHQQHLTSTLMQATPRYAPEPITSDVAMLQHLSACSGLPVWLGSYGPTHRDVRVLQAGAAFAEKIPQ
ncbi:MAG: adenylosuccinate synthetase [Rhodoferax sp.]